MGLAPELDAQKTQIDFMWRIILVPPRRDKAADVAALAMF